jgi:hypothetical protein
MAKANEKIQAAPAGTTGASAPVTGSGDDEMSEWHGQFGGQVDGWWSPPADATASVTGILVNFIDKARSEKLQSNSLVFELVEGAEHVKNGGSDKIPGSKGDGKLHKAPKTAMVAVPEWKQLMGMWPAKAGHKFVITRGPKRSIGKGRSMYDLKILVSNKALKHIEVTEDTTSDDATGGISETPGFQVEAEA